MAKTAPVVDDKSNKTEATAPKAITKSKPKAKKELKPEASIPRGQPKSNRPWKTPKQKWVETITEYMNVYVCSKILMLPPSYSL